jgi:alpha-tubulin suppressor-like RCC1 family protein
MRSISFGTLTALTLLAAACGEQPTGAVETPLQEPLLAAVRCHADRQTLSCENGGETGMNRSVIIFGGQSRYVRLASSGTAYDSVTAPSQVQLPAGVTFSVIRTAGQHTCALGSDGAAYCWGRDLDGQLGNGSVLTANQESPSQVQMPAGVTFSTVEAAGNNGCAVGSDDHTYCWGRDVEGQLGNGTVLTANQPAPTQVQEPAGVRFTGVDIGNNHVCAIGSDGKAYCWGYDSTASSGTAASSPGISPRRPWWRPRRG